MAYTETEPGTTRRSGKGPLIVAILLLVGAVWWMGDALFDWDPFQNDRGIQVETRYTDLDAEPTTPVAVTRVTEVWTLPQDNMGTPVQDLVTVSETVSNRVIWVRPNTADAQHPRLLAVLQQAQPDDVGTHAAQLQGILTSPDAILNEWDLEPAERQAIQGQQAVILVTDFQPMTEAADVQPFTQPDSLTTQEQTPASQEEPMVTR